MKKLNITIPGTPKPKQSARFRTFKSGNKNFVQSYQSKEVKENERSIKMIVLEQLPKDFTIHKGAIIVSKLYYLFPPIKSLKKWQKDFIESGGIVPKTTKPDLTDNLSKGLFDALEGIVFVNDSQICCTLNSLKGYNNRPRIELELELYESNEEAFNHLVPRFSG